jgi:uncharacterized protein
MSNNPILGLCTLEFYLPGMTSLKDKRSITKSMLARLRNTFNVSAAEVGFLDQWQSAGIAVTTVSNSSQHVNEVLHNVINWIEANFPDALLVKQEIEIL